MWKKGNINSSARDQVEGRFNVDVLTCISYSFCDFDSCALISSFVAVGIYCVYIYIDMT